jgi:hypothetical protein
MPDRSEAASGAAAQGSDSEISAAQTRLLATAILIVRALRRLKIMGWKFRHQS